MQFGFLASGCVLFVGPVSDFSVSLCGLYASIDDNLSLTLGTRVLQ